MAQSSGELNTISYGPSRAGNLSLTQPMLGHNVDMRSGEAACFSRRESITPVVGPAIFGSGQIVAINYSVSTTL